MPKQMNWMGGSKNRLQKAPKGRPKDVVRYKQKKDATISGGLARSSTDPDDLLDRQAELFAKSINPDAGPLEIARRRAMLVEMERNVPPTPPRDPLADFITAQCPDYLRPDACVPKLPPPELRKPAQVPEMKRLEQLPFCNSRKHSDAMWRAAGGDVQNNIGEVKTNRVVEEKCRKRKAPTIAHAEIKRGKKDASDAKKPKIAAKVRGDGGPSKAVLHIEEMLKRHQRMNEEYVREQIENKGDGELNKSEKNALKRLAALDTPAFNIEIVRASFPEKTAETAETPRIEPQKRKLRKRRDSVVVNETVTAIDAEMVRRAEEYCAGKVERRETWKELESKSRLRVAEKCGSKNEKEEAREAMRQEEAREAMRQEEAREAVRQEEARQAARLREESENQTVEKETVVTQPMGTADAHARDREAQEAAEIRIETECIATTRVKTPLQEQAASGNTRVECQQRTPQCRESQGIASLLEAYASPCVVDEDDEKVDRKVEKVEKDEKVAKEGDAHAHVVDCDLSHSPHKSSSASQRPCKTPSKQQPNVKECASASREVPSSSRQSPPSSSVFPFGFSLRSAFSTYITPHLPFLSQSTAVSASTPNEDAGKGRIPFNSAAIEIPHHTPVTPNEDPCKGRIPFNSAAIEIPHISPATPNEDTGKGRIPFNSAAIEIPHHSPATPNEDPCKGRIPFNSAAIEIPQHSPATPNEDPCKGRIPFNSATIEIPHHSPATPNVDIGKGRIPFNSAAIEIPHHTPVLCCDADVVQKLPALGLHPDSSTGSTQKRAKWESGGSSSSTSTPRLLAERAIATPQLGNSIPLPHSHTAVPDTHAHMPTVEATIAAVGPNIALGANSQVPIENPSDPRAPLPTGHSRCPSVGTNKPSSTQQETAIPTVRSNPNSICRTESAAAEQNISGECCFTLSVLPVGQIGTETHSMNPASHGTEPRSAVTSLTQCGAGIPNSIAPQIPSLAQAVAISALSSSYSSAAPVQGEHLPPGRIRVDADVLAALGTTYAGPLPACFDDELPVCVDVDKSCARTGKCVDKNPVQGGKEYPTQVENAAPTSIDHNVPARVENAAPTSIDHNVPTQVENAVPTNIDHNVPARVENAVPARVDHKNSAKVADEVPLDHPVRDENAVPANLNHWRPAPGETAMNARFDGKQPARVDVPVRFDDDGQNTRRHVIRPLSDPLQVDLVKSAPPNVLNVIRPTPSAKIHVEDPVVQVNVFRPTAASAQQVTVYQPTANAQQVNVCRPAPEDTHRVKRGRQREVEQGHAQRVKVYRPTDASTGHSKANQPTPEDTHRKRSQHREVEHPRHRNRQLFHPRLNRLVPFEDFMRDLLHDTSQRNLETPVSFALLRLYLGACGQGNMFTDLMDVQVRVEKLLSQRDVGIDEEHVAEVVDRMLDAIL